MADITDYYLSTLRDLHAREVAVQKYLSVMYADALEDVWKEQQRFARYVEEQRKLGRTSPSWLSRDARYLSLQSQLTRALTSLGVDLRSVLPEQIASSALDAAAKVEPEVKVAARAGGVPYPGYGPETWAVINKRAIDLGLAAIKGTSPLFGLLESRVGIMGVLAFSNAWRQGIVLGRNPMTIARQAQTGVTRATLSRMQTIVRTEWHRAYRTAKASQYEQLDIIKGWVWRAALDGRTCVICYAMHGTEHQPSEILESHPNCRCTMVPITKSWEELGYAGVLDSAPEFTKGTDLFSKLPPSRQRELLGPGRYELYRSGKPLSAMMRPSSHPIWGSAQRLIPLYQLSPAANGAALAGVSTAGRTMPTKTAQYVATSPMTPYAATRWENAARVEGMSLEAFTKQQVAAMQKTLDSKVLASRRSMRSAINILTEGVFKTQFSTQQSAGLFSPKERAEREATMFGFGKSPKSIPASERPVYGYMDDLRPNDAAGAGAYGEVRFVFKDSVRDRATVTFEDSLWSDTLPSPVKAVAPKSYLPRNLTPAPVPGGPYIEVQYHGGLTIDDVRRIDFTWGSPSAEMQVVLKSRGFNPAAGGVRIWERQ